MLQLGSGQVVAGVPAGADTDSKIKPLSLAEIEKLAEANERRELARIRSMEGAGVLPAGASSKVVQRDKASFFSLNGGQVEKNVMTDDRVTQAPCSKGGDLTELNLPEPSQGQSPEQVPPSPPASQEEIMREEEQSPRPGEERDPVRAGCVPQLPAAMGATSRPGKVSSQFPPDVPLLANPTAKMRRTDGGFNTDNFTSNVHSLSPIARAGRRGATVYQEPLLENAVTVV